MLVSKSALELFQISRDSLSSLREELVAAKAENVLLTRQLASLQANFDWLTTRVNQVEIERAQLLEKAYGIKTAVPEIAKAPTAPALEFNSLPTLFDDIGDKAARALGFPSYDSN